MFLSQGVYYPSTAQEMEDLSFDKQNEIVKRNNEYVCFCISLLGAILHNYSFREHYNTKENLEQQISSEGTSDKLGDLVKFLKMAESQCQKPSCMVFFHMGTGMIKNREQLSILMYCDDIETKLGCGVSLYYSQRNGLKTNVFINPSIRCEHDMVLKKSK